MQELTQTSAVHTNSPVNPSINDSSPQKNNNSLPQKRRLIQIFFLIPVIIILSFIGGWWYSVRILMRSELSSHIAPSITVTPSGYIFPSPFIESTTSPISYNYAINLTELPVLFPDLSWQEVDPRNSRIKEYEVLYVTSDDSSYYYKGVKLPGEEWTTQKNYTEDEGWTTTSQNLLKYFEDNLSKIGWGPRIQLPGYTLHASAADGPLGSVWGFVGIKDKQVRVITIEEERRNNGDGKCPCKLTYWVNISNITPFEEVLKLLKSNISKS